MKKILNTPFWLVCLVFVGLINSCKESKKDAVAEAETVAEVTPENALKSYLENGDETFSWVSSQIDIHTILSEHNRV